jgi:hypothetical protein
MCMLLCCEQPIVCNIYIATWRPARNERIARRVCARPYTPSEALSGS